jgi:hypothetical protein
MGWVVKAMPRSLYPQEREPVSILWEAGWAPGSVWKDEENLSPTGIRSRDRAARSGSLYWLRYSVSPNSIIQRSITTRYVILHISNSRFIRHRWLTLSRKKCNHKYTELITKLDFLLCPQHVSTRLSLHHDAVYSSQNSHLYILG